MSVRCIVQRKDRVHHPIDQFQLPLYASTYCLSNRTSNAPHPENQEGGVPDQGPARRFSSLALQANLIDRERMHLTTFRVVQPLNRIEMTLGNTSSGTISSHI